MSNYDVIVVGAGCAGPAAAKKAAESGLRIKASMPDMIKLQKIDKP